MRLNLKKREPKFQQIKTSYLKQLLNVGGWSDIIPLNDFAVRSDSWTVDNGSCSSQCDHSLKWGLNVRGISNTKPWRAVR